jgi:hypothetical protein
MDRGQKVKKSVGVEFSGASGAGWSRLLLYQQHSTLLAAG